MKHGKKNGENGRILKFHFRFHIFFMMFSISRGVKVAVRMDHQTMLYMTTCLGVIKLSDDLSVVQVEDAE